MYPTSPDTQRCIWNNKVIIAQVVVEWKRQKQNTYPQNTKIGFLDLLDVYKIQNNMKNVDKS